MAVDLRVCARCETARDEIAFAVVPGDPPGRDELDTVQFSPGLRLHRVAVGVAES